jgi:hypothetical protein
MSGDFVHNQIIFGSEEAHIPPSLSRKGRLIIEEWPSKAQFYSATAADFR